MLLSINAFRFAISQAHCPLKKSTTLQHTRQKRGISSFESAKCATMWLST